MISAVEVAIDFGGSTTKICIAEDGRILTTPVLFPNETLYSAKTKTGRKIA